MLRFVTVPIICMKIRSSILGLTVTGLHSEGRGRCPAHRYPSPGTRGCGSYTLGHSLRPRGCGSSYRGRGRLIRPPWIPPFSEQKNFRLLWIFFWRMFVTPLLMSPILYFWEMSGVEPRELQAGALPT
jgi:hypothetical protein